MKQLESIKEFLKSHYLMWIYFFVFQLVRIVSTGVILNKSGLVYYFDSIVLGTFSNILLLMLPYLIFKTSLRKYLYFISVPLIVSNLFYLIHLFHLKAPITLGAIAVIAETNPGEASDFISSVGFKVISCSIVLAILPLLVLFFCKANNEIKSIGAKASIYLILPFYLIVNLGLSYFTSKGKVVYRKLNPFHSSFVFQDVKQVAYYFREQKKLKQYIENRPDFKFEASYTGASDSLLVVLIIGESMSKSHLQLYGYPRETTPKLNSLKNLYVYKDVVSPATQTRESIIRMMSLARGKYEDLFYNTGSIFTAAKEAGYYTYWLSNQMMLGISDTENSVIANDADYSKFINSDWSTASLDENMLPHLAKFLNDKNSAKKFIVLHMLGNHFKYENRYAEKSATVFSDDVFADYHTSHHKAVINHYDNSIRYSDEFIYNAIKLIEKNKKPAVVVYLSDHGEEVFDNKGLFVGHGSPKVRKEAVDIPFLLWFSEEYGVMNRFPNINATLLNKYITEDLFYTLVDLMELSFEAADSTKSIVSPNFVEKERFILNSNNQLINYKRILLNNKNN
ncbi:MAG: phosphoethanolamine transferase [Flavobacteriales bacterium]|nr:phosphoethanolamine transferase [Flavobacteriales bacterium]